MRERFELAPGYVIPRIIRGGWQLAGDHGDVDRARAVQEIERFVNAGLNTVDGADIYAGVEDIYGEFNALRGAQGLSRLQVHTKCVPDFDDLARVDEGYVRRIVERSKQRLRTERIDLVQFHWWDYKVPGCIESAQCLERLRKEGAIAHIGGTNFDTPHSLAMIEAGVPLVSMQVQYSLLDRRPASSLAFLSKTKGMHLICYGTLAGGFFSEQWLGVAEPTTGLRNRSLIKYKLIIDDFGGWDAFQALLGVLAQIGKKHGVRIPVVATRWVLDQTGVAAAIVGSRYADHLADTLAVESLKLDAVDRATIDALLQQHPGPQGDTYSLERDKAGRHGSIMKYNLNSTESA